MNTRTDTDKTAAPEAPQTIWIAAGNIKEESRQDDRVFDAEDIEEWQRLDEERNT